MNSHTVLRLFSFLIVLSQGRAILLPEVEEFTYFLNLFKMLFLNLDTNCVNIISHDRNVSQADNRATNFGFATLKTFKLVKHIARNDIRQGYVLINSRKCDYFLVFTDDEKFVERILTSTSKHPFFPLTNIFLIFYGNSISNINQILLQGKIAKINNRRAINVVSIHLDFNHIMNCNYSSRLYFFSYNLNLRIIDYTRNTSIAALNNFFHIKKWEPLFNKYDEDHIFRVTLFHCPPFVLNTGTIGNTTSYDGVEYRFLQEATKGWNIKIIDLDRNCSKCDPWHELRLKIFRNETDMTLCSMGMTKENFDLLDLSSPYDYQCETFLVPLSAPISKVRYIYMALESSIWLLYISYFCVVCLILVVLAKAALKHKIGNAQFMKRFNLSRSFIEIINVSTLHGMSLSQANHSIRVLMASWTFLSLVIGTCYSTGYISILTQPRLEKPINTLRDMIEQDIFWGTMGDKRYRRDPFYDTNNTDYIEIANRLVKENNLEDRRRNFATGKYARYVKILCQNFVTESETIIDNFRELRFMKECLFNYFSVYGFQKNTPFSSYFSVQNTRLVEAGIYQFWFKDIDYRYNPAMMDILFDGHTAKSIAKPFTLTNLSSAFYLLGIGMGLSIFTLSLEVIYHYATNKRN